MTIPIPFCYTSAPMGQQLRTRVKRAARLRRKKRLKKAAWAQKSKAKPAAPAAAKPTA